MIPISVIVPMFNAEKYIGNCIDSLLRQSIEKEIILIDDGSDDQTYKIAEKYRRDNDCISLIHQENAGQSSARNAGLRMAKGEYIFFCDADDEIESESLPELYRLCAENDLDILKTGWRTRTQTGDAINCPSEKDIPENMVLSSREYFERSIASWHNVVPWNGFFRRDFLLKNELFFPEGIQFEDNTFHLKALLTDENARVMQSYSTFYIVNVRENSTTTTKPKPKKVYDQLENIRLMNEFADNCLPDVILRNKAKIAISSLVFTMTSYYYRMDREYRPELSKAIPREVLAEAIAHPQTRFQQAKLFLFAYLRPLLDIYEFFHMR